MDEYGADEDCECRNCYWWLETGLPWGRCDWVDQPTSRMRLMVHGGTAALLTRDDWWCNGWRESTAQSPEKATSNE